MSRKRKRSRYEFTEKTHSKKGIVSMLMGIALICVYIAFISISYTKGGNLSMYYGSAGVLAFLFSFTSFVLAVQSVREENSFKAFPRLAMLFSVISVVCWAGTYAIGF